MAFAPWLKANRNCQPFKGGAGCTTEAVETHCGIWVAVRATFVKCSVARRGGDAQRPLVQNVWMEEPDWFLREWLQDRGLRQADVVRALGFDKPRVSKLVHKRVPYRRDLVNAFARWLEIEPYELLMHPAEAKRLRQLAEAARMLVSSVDVERRD